jgi:hypothetical protein
LNHVLGATNLNLPATLCIEFTTIRVHVSGTMNNDVNVVALLGKDILANRDV